MSPSEKAGKQTGGDLFDSVVGTAADAFVEHALPWMAKKTVEMGRYGASELMRNKNLQKKAVNYGINKLTPFIQKSVGSAMDELSTKVRPNKRYKTDRKDLDGRGMVDSALKSGAFGSPFHVDIKKGVELITDPELFAPVYKIPKEDALALVRYYKDEYKKAKANGYKKSYNSFVKEMGWGAGVDIHKAILKVAPSKGFVLPGHRYTGPGNPLESQLRYDPQTGKILEIFDQPTGRTDAVSMQHDVDYSVCGNKPTNEQIKCKNEADRKMIKSLDAIPWKQRQWGHSLARTMINTKQKLGLGLQKNARRR